MGTVLFDMQPNVPRKSWADMIEEEEANESKRSAGKAQSEELFELLDKNSRDGFNLEFKLAFSLCKDNEAEDSKSSKRLPSNPWNASTRPFKVLKVNESQSTKPNLEEDPSDNISPIENDDDANLSKLNKENSIIETSKLNVDDTKLKAPSRGRSEERETNESRLAQREKQIRIGKNTEAYKRYSEMMESDQK
jgi:hypothetical protein